MITEKDFYRLSHTNMGWKEYGRDWQDLINENRFDPTPKSTLWRTAYWFEDYSAALLAKMYLDQEEIPYEMFSDEWSMDWVIVADLNNG